MAFWEQFGSSSNANFMTIYDHCLLADVASPVPVYGQTTSTTVSLRLWVVIVQVGHRFISIHLLPFNRSLTSCVWDNKYVWNIIGVSKGRHEDVGEVRIWWRCGSRTNVQNVLLSAKSLSRSNAAWPWKWRPWSLSASFKQPYYSTK